MPQVQTSIIIDGDIDQIFEITNDIERWTQLFGEYRSAKLLSYNRHERFAKIEFELTNEEGETWQSWRILDFQDHMAIAQRGTPKYPFKYMHLTWSYEPVEGGVKMTWIQDFEIDPKASLTNEQAYQRMETHMKENQKHFKEVLESQFGDTISEVSSLNKEPSLPFVPPTQIIETTFAFAQSAMFLAAVELQIFTHIAHGARTPAQIAEQAGVAQPALERLLGGLLAMGFLRRVGQYYHLTPMGEHYLVSDRPTYAGDVALHIRQEWDGWINLADVVRTGQPTIRINEEPVGGKFFGPLVDAIFSINYPLMQRIFKRLELGTRLQGAQVLELGAGNAPASTAALELDQRGHATLVDFALVLERAKKRVEEHGIGDRVTYWPKDLNDLALPTNQFDFTIVSHVFRVLGAELTQRLMSQIYQGLKTNGRLIILEIYSEPERYWKLFPHIVSINMLLNTPSGDAFTLAQMSQLLQDTGFQVDVWNDMTSDPIVVATRL